MSPAALLAAAEVLQQECLAVSDDYIRNPTLVKTLAASVATCLQAVKVRESSSETVRAGSAAVQAAALLLRRSDGEGKQVAQAGLIPETLLILQKLDAGMVMLLSFLLDKKDDRPKLSKICVMLGGIIFSFDALSTTS